MAVIDEIEVAAGDLRFETFTAGGAECEPVILLHGYPQSARAWDRSLEWLAAHGYRAIAPNLRGYSPGANPEAASAYRMEMLVADVVAIADALAAPGFHLVGHDWGGGLAWEVAVRIPERVLSLTVISTPHPVALLEAIRSSNQFLRSSYMAFFRLPQAPEALLSAFDFAAAGLACRLTGLPPRAWSRDRANLRRVGLRGPLNWFRAAAHPPPRRGRIEPSTLYVWGRRDAFLGRRAADLTARHVRGPYRFVELDAGHWIPDCNPEELHGELGEHLAANRGGAGAVAPPAAEPPQGN